MLLIRIQELDHGQSGYPLELLIANDDGTWPDQPVATDVIPETLVTAGPECQHHKPGVAAIRSFLLATTDESDHFVCIGRYLHDLVARGAVADRWRQERTNGAGTLLYVGPEILRRLPWELVVDGQRRLFLEDAPISRVLDDTPAEAAVPLGLPVRLLVIVGAAPGDHGVLAEEEALAIRRAVGGLNGQIDPVLLIRPKKAELIDVLADVSPNLLHFIGHAHYNGGETSLAIEVEGTGATWYWTLAEMMVHLPSERPRLVILNACRTADADAHGHVWNLAERLVTEAGVQAVVGMQADVEGRSAVAFARGMYEAIGEGKSVDLAVAEARKAIEAGSQLLQREWALPSLVGAVRPEPLLATASIPVASWNSIKGSPEFEELDCFVDRERQRAELRSAVLVSADEAQHTVPAHNITLVMSAESTSGDKFGKSELAKWCLRQCLFMGMEVRYVDLASTDPRSLLEMLVRIREGGHGSLLARPIVGTTIESIDLDLGATPSTNELSQIITTFRQGLIEAAEGRPFVLVLDHLSGVAEGALTALAEHIDDLAGGSVEAPVRLVLVANGETMKDKIPKQLPLIAECIELPKIDSSLYRTLVLQYLCHLIDDSVELQQMASACDVMNRERPWVPGRLRMLKDLVV